MGIKTGSKPGFRRAIVKVASVAVCALVWSFPGGGTRVASAQGVPASVPAGCDPIEAVLAAIERHPNVKRLFTLNKDQAGRVAKHFDVSFEAVHGIVIVLNDSDEVVVSIGVEGHLCGGARVQMQNLVTIIMGAGA